MRRILPFAVLLAALSVSLFRSAQAYEDLGLRPLARAHDLGVLDLQTRDRLARIDSLEANWGELSEDERSERHAQITQLFAGGSLIKHRVWAAEMAEETPGFSDYSLGALLAGGWARERGMNPRQAMQIYDIACVEYPDSAAAHREAGRARLEAGRRRLDENMMEEAVECYRRATACPDASSDDWLGLASIQLALGRHNEIYECLEYLDPADDASSGVLFYRAVALTAKGLVNEAGRYFQLAIAQLQPDTRDWFLEAEDFFGAQPLQFMDTAVADYSPPPALGLWWIRLLEVDILLGNRRWEVNGWQTYPGALFIRYGRPQRVHFFVQRPELDQLTMEFGLGHVRNQLGLELTLWGDRPGWMWIYELEGMRVPFFFYQFNIFTQWIATPLSRDRTKLVAGRIPVVLTSLQENPQLELTVRHAAYRTPEEFVRAESYFAIRRRGKTLTAGPDSFRTTVTVLGADGQTLERVERRLGSSHRRSTLIAAVLGPQPEDDTILGQLSVDLWPARYTLRLEVEDLITGEYQAHDRSFELKPQARSFEMSDLLLCDTFAAYREGMEVPNEFLRYAHVVIPHPDGRVLPGQEDLFVYYEVYGAQLDDRGQAHLDVIYEVFAEEDFHPFEAGLNAGEPGASKAKIRAVFPDERIGRSARGVVVKGTHVDLTELDPGGYVVAVLVSDLLGHDEARRYVKFKR